MKNIFNEQDYQEALTRIDEIIDSPEGSSAHEELSKLGYLVCEYEDMNHPILAPEQDEEKT